MVNEILNSRMRKFITIVESNLVPYDHGQALQGEISGPHREGMTVQQAKAYLDEYPDGVLCWDGFETESFVAVNKYGIYVFYNANTDRIEHWDWKQDIAELQKYYERDQDYDPMVEWWYNDAGEQLSMTKGGMEFWERIRNGLEVPQ